MLIVLIILTLIQKLQSHIFLKMIVRLYLTFMKCVLKKKKIIVTRSYGERNWRIVGLLTISLHTNTESEVAGPSPEKWMTVSRWRRSPLRVDGGDSVVCDIKYNQGWVSPTHRTAIDGRQVKAACLFYEPVYENKICVNIYKYIYKCIMRACDPPQTQRCQKCVCVCVCVCVRACACMGGLAYFIIYLSLIHI